MFYCAKCQKPSKNQTCEICGKKKILDAIKQEDLIYLGTLNSFESGLFEGLLKQNNIKFIQQSTLGAGIASRVGANLESFKFFVNYIDLESAQELLTFVNN